MSDKKDLKKSTANNVNAFLTKVASTPVIKPMGDRGRLLFAMDATASREPTWDQACQIQAEMFTQTEALGGLEVQLVYYRGLGQCAASPWLRRAADLQAKMSAVSCLGGHTQIRKILQHTLKESKQKKVDALVFVGDCMEENADTLCDLAGRLSLQGVPIFIFHEGYDTVAARAFRQMAHISNGAYCRFDPSSAQQLRDLLGAVAVYAAGGVQALQDFNNRKGQPVLQLMHKKT